MITIIDDTTVAVDTFADLQSILQANNAYTLVYLAADITMTAGIAILPGKTEVTIDGLYPTDGTGTIHTLNDYASSATGGTLGLRSSSSISMTIQNMNIVGQNYYGILYVPEGSGYAGVTSTYRNITYVGPQFTYNPSGRTRYIDCDITIQKAYSNNEEVGEVYQLEIGGRTTINHTTTGSSMFWFRGNSNSPSFTVLEDAVVNITTANYGIYTSNAVALTIAPNAVLNINSNLGLCNSLAHRFTSILVDTGASFSVVRSSGTVPTVYVQSAFTVNEGASVYMQSTHASAPAHIYFYSSGVQLNVSKPKSFVLYNSTGAVFNFNAATAATLSGEQLNNWLATAAIETAGTLDDMPFYSWRKSDGSDFSITASATSSATTVTSSNFTEDELVHLPDFAMLQLAKVRAVSIGRLALEMEAITDDAYPVTGRTDPDASVRVKYMIDDIETILSGNSDGNGKISMDTAVSLTEGGQVEITVNRPFLYTSLTATVVPAGELVLGTVPEELPFVIEPISTEPLLFGRQDENWRIIVMDSRVRGGTWYLYATLTQPMTGEIASRILKDSLVYIDENDAITIFKDTPVLVYTGQSNRGQTEGLSVSWPKLKGILMQASEQPFYQGEHYTAPISWTLTDTPIDQT